MSAEPSFRFPGDEKAEAKLRERGQGRPSCGPAAAGLVRGRACRRGRRLSGRRPVVVPLCWMIEEARSPGTGFEHDSDYTARGDPDRPIYDPRAGAGLLWRYQPRNVQS